ncbi:hypothetical protein FB567DRAFT_534611 [Paraphoma chrysanthemicola]|uniref:gamma-glutamylcyclotransferase n=1 Tax=Paraphoma chrysanthemicola TaxID=798071 RepID=A0A8K0VU95_9PLEO|nr:hypothetical protein FB567DRAFT_534611 [Paraphoma chrysanthemicola]
MTLPFERHQHQPNRPNHAEPEQEEAGPFYLRLIERLQSRGGHRNAHKRVFGRLPETSQDRLDGSLNDVPFDTDKLVAASPSTIQEKEKTVLYLAYGSNLCNETFRGRRGIRPLSQVNVLVPSLRLTFDLPGIPYAEPCFANTARRVPDAPVSHNDSLRGDDYHKDRWHKGLVGVVYEVTMSDYAHIIATEGGGSSYKDILVDCHVLPFADTVPTIPTSKPFKAHTLFAPMVNSDRTMCCATERVSRPDPSYAQPSARYLKLITDGAIECDLPAEYQEYLHDIRPYTITSKKQLMGKALFLSIWMPFVLLIFALSKQLQDDKGRAPKWFAPFSAMVFKGMWTSYDGAFKKVFGEGERTVGDEALEKRVDKPIGVRDVEEEGLLEEAFVRLDKQAMSTGDSLTERSERNLV